MGHLSVRPGARHERPRWLLVASLWEAFDVEAAETVAVRRRVASGRGRVALANVAGVCRRADDRSLCLVVDPTLRTSPRPWPMHRRFRRCRRRRRCRRVVRLRDRGTIGRPPPCWERTVLTSTVLELPAPAWLADAPLCAFCQPPLAAHASCVIIQTNYARLFVAVAVAEASFCWETPCSPPCPAEPSAGRRRWRHDDHDRGRILRVVLGCISALLSAPCRRQSLAGPSCLWRRWRSPPRRFLSVDPAAMSPVMRSSVVTGGVACTGLGRTGRLLAVDPFRVLGRRNAGLPRYPPAVVASRADQLPCEPVPGSLRGRRGPRRRVRGRDRRSLVIAACSRGALARRHAERQHTECHETNHCFPLYRSLPPPRLAPPKSNTNANLDHDWAGNHPFHGWDPRVSLCFVLST